MQSQSIGEITKALSNVQANLTGAVKDKENPFFKSSYADLASVWEACRPLLAKNHLAVVQTTDVADCGVVIITTLSHSSGEWFKGRLHIVPEKKGPQAIGSAITYGRRYALAAIVGISPADDDGNAASNHNGGAPRHETTVTTVGVDPPINEMQQKTLTLRMNEVGADPVQFFGFLKTHDMIDMDGVDRLEQLPKSVFQFAMDCLTAKASRAKR